MIDPSVIPPTDEEAPVTQATTLPPLSQIESLIRRHPLAAALTTLGFGCAAGIVAREILTPRTAPKHRALQLLQEIQSRLTEFTEPACERARHLAEDGVTAIKNGVHSAGSSKLASRPGRLFS